eukprot:2461734-Amphidinium_carterae.1
MCHDLTAHAHFSCAACTVATATKAGSLQEPLIPRLILLGFLVLLATLCRVGTAQSQTYCQMKEQTAHQVDAAKVNQTISATDTLREASNI